MASGVTQPLDSHQITNYACCHRAAGIICNRLHIRHKHSGHLQVWVPFLQASAASWSDGQPNAFLLQWLQECLIWMIIQIYPRIGQICERSSIRQLLGAEFRRSHSSHLLEDTIEVVNIFKSEKMGCFADIMALHQEVLAPFNYKGMDICNCSSSCGLSNDISKVTWRIRKFWCTELYRWNPGDHLPVFWIVIVKKSVIASEDIRPQS